MALTLFFIEKKITVLAKLRKVWFAYLIKQNSLNNNKKNRADPLYFVCWYKPLLRSTFTVTKCGMSAFFCTQQLR